jgi:hypothetical protein
VPYTVPATGGSFTFVSQPADFATAAAGCASRGGWLASYDTFREQSELEGWLVEGVGGRAGWADCCLPACLPACVLAANIEGSLTIQKAASRHAQRLRCWVLS